MDLNKAIFGCERDCVDSLALLLSEAPLGYSIFCYSEEHSELILGYSKTFISNKDLKSYISNLKRSQRYVTFSVDNKSQNICFRGREKVVSLSIKAEMIILDFYSDETCNPYLMTDTKMGELIKKNEGRFNTAIKLKPGHRSYLNE